MSDITKSGIKGGQGRDAEDVEEAGCVAVWVVIIAVIIGIAWVLCP